MAAWDASASSLLTPRVYSQAEAEFATYMSTKYGARGVPVEVGIAANALFEDETLTVPRLEERLAALA